MGTEGNLYSGRSTLQPLEGPNSILGKTLKLERQI